MTRAVLWDLDGTLVDSGEMHWWSWRDTLGAINVPLTYEQFTGTFGQKNDRILRSWLGPDATAARIAEVAEAKESEYRRLVSVHGLQPLPGAPEWVERLRAEGWRQTIASSAPRKNVEVMLVAIGLAAAFDGIVAAEDVGKGKPDPEVFLTAAARLGATPASSIVVEDAAAGIEAARRAGIRCIGVTDPTLQADVVVASLTDLAPDAFDRLIAIV
jgi:HAD superfamily hydrolase (TIGR01509 family)